MTGETAERLDVERLANVSALLTEAVADAYHGADNPYPFESCEDPFCVDAHRALVLVLGCLPAPSDLTLT